MATVRRSSMREVATTAGVAMSTISRVLSGHPDVSPQMRERVLQVVHDLGYEPDFLAQSLRRGATYSVGFILSDISNPVLAQTARGIEEVLRQAGYSLLVMNSENDPVLDAAHVRVLESRRVDGLILCVASERKRATIAALSAVHMPIVSLDRDFPRRLQASAVLSNHRTGIAAAVDHLLALGHRRIGLISLPLEMRPGRERLAGLRDAYRARALPDTSVHVAAAGGAPEAETATLAMLDDRDPATAIIAGANQLLTGCLRAVVRRGLRLGADLSLVSCDDTPLAELYTPPIATVSRDNVAIGRVAADLLLRRLRGDAEPRTVVLETTFQPRASCAALRA